MKRCRAQIKILQSTDQYLGYSKSIEIVIHRKLAIIWLKENFFTIVNYVRSSDTWLSYLQIKILKRSDSGLTLVSYLLIWKRLSIPSKRFVSCLTTPSGEWTFVVNIENSYSSWLKNLSWAPGDSISGPLLIKLMWLGRG